MKTEKKTYYHLLTMNDVEKKYTTENQQIDYTYLKQKFFNQLTYISRLIKGREKSINILKQKMKYSVAS